MSTGRQTIAALLLGALVGCGSATSDAADPADEATQRPSEAPPLEEAPLPEGFVVLSTGTRLFRRPSADAPSVAVAGQELAAFEVIEAQTLWVRVRNLDAKAAKRHCASGWESVQAFALELWVRESDIDPVTRRPVIEKFDDGTSVMLSAGVPTAYAREGSGVRRADALGAMLELELGEAEIGRYYQPSALFKPGETQRRLPSAAALTLPVPFDPTTLRGAPEVLVFDETWVGDKRLVTVGTRCAELRAFASEPTIDGADPARIAAILGGLGSDPPIAGDMGLGTGDASHTVKRGTKILWPDGEAAGEVIADTSLPGSPQVHSDTRCFRIGPSLDLCFKADDVKSVNPLAGGLVGFGRGRGPEPGGGVPGGVIGGVPGGVIGGVPGGVPGGVVGGVVGGTLGGAKKVPRVRASKATVAGSLDKDIIRRIVRAHINEVRHCYNAGLKKDPTLAGRVEVSFTISPAGKVSASKVKSHTLGTKDVPNCIAKAVKRWKFPKPLGGGVVAVTYPFVLSPG